jgi:hypothetical protein
MRHARQVSKHLRRRSPAVKCCVIGQERQVALVCVQRMHARIGCNDDSVVEIGRTQILVFEIAEGKIDQSVIDKIDWPPLREQLTALVPNLIAIHNYRVDAVLLEETLSQQELRIKILLCWPIINDCDSP